MDVDGLAPSIAALGLEQNTLRVSPAFRRRVISGSAVIALLVLAGLGLRAYLRSPTRGLPYRDSFTRGNADEWQAFGGTWELADGTMHNDSDERGAKLLTGSTFWRDYSVEGDVMIQGVGGDAGLMIRSSDEEQGVDSYTGYYAGLRTRDNSLVLGRAAHGWMEFTLKAAKGTIEPGKWYHLKLLAVGCQLVTSASGASVTKATTISIRDKDCVPSGRVGLRSYASGGVWRNIVVHPASQKDLLEMLGKMPGGDPSAPQPSKAEHPEILESFGAVIAHSSPPPQYSNVHAQPIGDLRLLSSVKPVTATVRGVVILTSPVLVVQDSTGGVSIPEPATPPLKVGDEVEVTGEVRTNPFSSRLEKASVRVLWEGSPMPAVSVTASQAATGAFDATFVEVEGRLRAKEYGPDNTLVFDFDAGPQSFRAIMSRGRGDLLFSRVKPNSLLRLRGICLVDAEYTGNLMPFVLLLRSTDDMDVLAGPPWWSTGHVLALAIGILLLALVGTLFYGRIERWRLHAVLEERERLAHEMHDTLAQSFAGIGFQLEAIRSGIPQELPATHQQLDLASDLVRHSHEEARRSIASLRPQPVENGDLLATLGACAKRLVHGGTVQVVTSCKGEVRPMPLRITDTLFRIGQEAIANAVRHAHPSTLAISVEYRKNAAVLTITDDGIGFTQGGDLRGFGVRGMRKRAAGISAALQILSSPGEGTAVRVAAPLPPRLTFFSWPKHLWKYLREHSANVEANRQPHPNSYRG
jgi:signal transduction histidine kinase